MTAPTVRAHIREAKRNLELHNPLSTSYTGIALDHIRRAVEEDSREIAEPLKSKPDIVRRYQVNDDLPSGSIVVRCDADGTPWVTADPVRAEQMPPVPPTPSRDVLYRVLYRAPVKPLVVGEAVANTEQLRQAKVGTVLRWNRSGTLRELAPDGKWYAPGIDYGVPTGDLGTGANPTVIYLPEEKS